MENIIQMGNDYLRIVTIGSLGMFCQIMYERLLQGTGRSILSMYTQGLGAIINIILDPIFIFGLKMGVAGAAVATIIGQFCGCALAIYFNHKRTRTSPCPCGASAPTGGSSARSTPSACPALS